MGFFSEYRQVNKLLKQKQQVVFYAESRHYYQYFKKLINDLLEKDNVDICYITSDAKDPLLQTTGGRMKVIHVKWMLGVLFSRIKAETMIMTMPDLGNYLFKRSAGVGEYIYMFHAAVSAHQQYRKNAFVNYDTIFCTGDYQYNEIRKAEELYGSNPKELIPYGYPLLDEIKQKSETHRENPAYRQTILIAPSWFEGCIFETCIEEVLKQLSPFPYDIVLRSHPEYEKRNRKKFRAIQQWIKKYPNISIDNLPNVIDRLPATDILITDRSGIAFEFAVGTGKPALFIDTPLKETNPAWRDIAIEPVENRLRNELGISLSPNKLDELPLKCKELEEKRKGFAHKMEDLKKETFYNAVGSYKKGLDYILAKINKS